MKKLFLLILSILSFSYSQTFTQTNIGYNYFINNSEDEMKVMTKNKIKTNFDYGLSLKIKKTNRHNLYINYKYSRLFNRNLVKQISTDESAKQVEFKGDYLLTNHNIDLNTFWSFKNFYCFGLGITTVFTNRTIDIENAALDRLFSIGIGANCFLEYSKMINKNICFLTKLTVRYTHSIWFDKGNRILNNYNQEFLTSSLTLGLGYKISI